MFGLWGYRYLVLFVVTCVVADVRSLHKLVANLLVQWPTRDTKERGVSAKILSE